MSFSKFTAALVLGAGLTAPGTAQVHGEAGPTPQTSTGRAATEPGTHPGKYGAAETDALPDTGASRDNGVAAPDSVGGKVPERMAVDSLRASGAGPTRPVVPVKPTSPREPPEIPDGGRGGSPRPTAPGMPDMMPGM